MLPKLFLTTVLAQRRAKKVEAFVGGLDADTWEFKFGQDMRRLAIEILIHVCGDSCFKYSGSNTTQIRRHGFYYVVVLEDWRRRRRGKYIRNARAYLALPPAPLRVPIELRCSRCASMQL